MISRALPTVHGSGQRMLAIGQAARLQTMAITLAHDLDHWAKHWPADPLAVKTRAAAVARIAAWREEARDWLDAVKRYDAPTVDDRPEMLRGGR